MRLLVGVRHARRVDGEIFHLDVLGPRVDRDDNCLAASLVARHVQDGGRPGADYLNVHAMGRERRKAVVRANRCTGQEPSSGAEQNSPTRDRRCIEGLLRR